MHDQNPLPINLDRKNIHLSEFHKKEDIPEGNAHAFVTC